MTIRTTRGRHHAETRRGPRAAHRMPRSRRRLVVFGAVGAVAVTGVGTAMAAWLAQGTGPANSKAITATDLTISAGTASADLYPGATGAVYLTVSNPNPYAVALTQASFGTVTTTPLSGKTCAASYITPVSAGPVTISTVNLAAHAGPQTVTIPNALRMDSTAEDGCQGASFSVVVTLSGTSA